jgi:hypothetical protein
VLSATEPFCRTYAAVLDCANGYQKEAVDEREENCQRKVRPTKKHARKGRAPEKLANRAAAPNKPVQKRKGLKKTFSGKAASVDNKQTRKKNQGRSSLAFSRETLGSRSGGQSGDLQGLSDVESVDSESVDELIEEGNAFEAGVVLGVEDAGERAEREVRTREVPEDDVPGEYLDRE